MCHLGDSESVITETSSELLRPQILKKEPDGHNYISTQQMLSMEACWAFIFLEHEAKLQRQTVAAAIRAENGAELSITMVERT